MKLLKKNQVIVYVIVLMLMAAGYLNYSANTEKQSVETAIQTESKDDMLIAGIGDATLVNSNDVTSNETTNDIAKNTQDENTTNTSNTTNNIETQEKVDEKSEEKIEEKVEENQNTVETNSKNTNDYFVKSKLERDTMYSQMLESYENVLNSSNTLENQKQIATQEIQKINETRNSIMICENLITTKGFENNIIFVNGESVSVIVGTGEIKQEEVAQIQNIISRELKVGVENIHISTK